MNGPRYTKLAQTLPSSVPFVGPEAQERARGAVFTARIGANENVFGPSPLAIAAMQDAVAGSWMYGDPENHDLRAALAKYHAITTDNIVVGEGIDALLGYLVRLLIEPGDRVVTSAGAYPTFNYHVAGYGGELITVPYRDDAEDPEALVAAARKTGAKLIYLANPDNPMGSWHGADKINDMIGDVPDGCLLILDEAYIDFAPAGTAPAIATDDGRVIRMRTFSKAYGMAGARVGYAIGEEILISAFNKIRNHFGMCRSSQAGALAALGDQQYLKTVVALVADSRRKIAEIGAANDLIALPSAANFVALDCGRDADYATSIMRGLVERGIFVRMPFVAPQNRCIRISAGTQSDLNALASTLPEAISEANKSTS
ncbi:MAG: pyridoxal phosphate-dependent aminotransferase [Paracoccaceae bacterium]